jgi:PAS domain S-box-containing protein
MYSDEKLAANRLANEHQLLSAVVDSVPHLIVWQDCDLIYRGCNQQFARAMGFASVDDVAGLTMADVPVFAEHSARYAEIDRKIVATGIPVTRLRETITRGDGEQRLLSMNRVPLRNGNSAVSGILIVIEDITEEEQAAQKVRDDEERWTLALEVNAVGVWDLDLGAGTLVGSRRWAELVPTAAGTSGMKSPLPSDLMHADELERFRAEWEALLSGTTSVLETGVQLRIGAIFRHMRLRGRVVRRDSAGRALRIIGTLADIHEAKLMQLQAANATKLESIGQLAAGIAHEINTPTQYVGDNVRFLGQAFTDIGAMLDGLSALGAGQEEIQKLLHKADIPYLREEVPKAISQSLDGIAKIGSIVGAMKEFSHPGQEKTLTDINRTIANAITVATNEWKYVAEVITDYDATMPMVPVIPGEFSQAILNIVVNAAHAIGDSKAAAGSGKGAIRVQTRHLQDQVEVCISDNGCGMPKHVQERSFDPFFTTKPVGKGTGQGLAIAHNVVVKKHGGTIAIKSEVGQGTMFTIRIPIAIERADEVAA